MIKETRGDVPYWRRNGSVKVASGSMDRSVFARFVGFLAWDWKISRFSWYLIVHDVQSGLVSRLGIPSWNSTVFTWNERGLVRGACTATIRVVRWCITPTGYRAREPSRGLEMQERTGPATAATAIMANNSLSDCQALRRPTQNCRTPRVHCAYGVPWK